MDGADEAPIQIDERLLQRGGRGALVLVLEGELEFLTELCRGLPGESYRGNLTNGTPAGFERLHYAVNQNGRLPGTRTCLDNEVRFELGYDAPACLRIIKRILIHILPA